MWRRRKNTSALHEEKTLRWKPLHSPKQTNSDNHSKPEGNQWEFDAASVGRQCSQAFEDKLFLSSV